MGIVISFVADIVLFLLAAEMEACSVDFRMPGDIMAAGNRRGADDKAQIESEACLIHDRGPCIEDAVPCAEAYIVV